MKVVQLCVMVEERQLVHYLIFYDNTNFKRRRYGRYCWYEEYVMIFKLDIYIKIEDQLEGNIKKRISKKI